MPTITDPALLVKRATLALTALRGAVVTPRLIAILADVVCDEFPRVPRQEIVEILSVRKIRGQLLTDDIAEERARQIAVLAQSRGEKEAA